MLTDTVPNDKTKWRVEAERMVFVTQTEFDTEAEARKWIKDNPGANWRLVRVREALVDFSK